MKKGPQRFEYFLARLEQLLLQASADPNPAWWLYVNNARTPLFMLEGLSRLYAGMHNRKRFDKLKDRFKLLEDALGSIDYYDCFAKEFSKNPLVPANIIEYLQAQSREKTQRLNELLIEEGWSGEKASRVYKTRKKLSGADWLEPKEELMAIQEFYRQATKEIKTFMASIPGRFTDLESQVHELRRMFRWLSIYPQALQGAIQLTDHDPQEPNLDKYLVPEVTNSPFNKMPEPGNNPYLLLFEKKYFLALSWMIAELGKIKDKGLSIMVVAEALQQRKTIGQEDARAQAIGLLANPGQDLPSILSRATDVCQQYFKEGNLDKIVSEIVRPA